MNETRLECPGELNRETGEALLATLRAGTIAPGDRVVLDFSGTREVNSMGGAWLVRIAQWVHGQEGMLDWEGQTGAVADFVEMVSPAFYSTEAAPVEAEALLERVGGAAIAVWDEARDFVGLLVDAIYWTFLALFDGRGFRWSLFVDEIYEMGVRAVGITALMNFLLGLIIAMLSAVQLEQFGASILVADLVVVAFAREFAVIMTGVVVSARTGAAIAAELATMEVQEEIDALRSMGVNVPQYLVAPKLLALLLVMPCLVAIGMLSGIFGGSLWGIFAMDIDTGAWMREVSAAAVVSDFMEGMYKAVAFAVAIVIIGCHNGFRVTGGSRGVGLMTTRAVVMDIFALIVIDMLFAWLFYYML